MVNAKIIISAALAALISAPAYAQSVEFRGLGFLNFGNFSYVYDLSADGLTAVGFCDSFGPEDACIASIDGFSFTNVGPSEPRAFGVSADGSVVVGATDFGSPFQQAFRWTRTDGALLLGDLPGGAEISVANDVSGDGSVIVGTGTSENGPEAFRWTEATGLVGLGFLVGGPQESYANGISQDGLVIVGGVGGAGAFRWTEVAGLLPLASPLDSLAPGNAYAASFDGSVIVGWGGSANGVEAFRWTESGGAIGLGDLPGGTFFSIARGVSSDGTVVVGSSDATGGLRAFRWTSAQGILSVEAVLSDAGVNIGDWVLTEATGVSGDGVTIVGNGLDPDGNNQAWLARIGVGFITPGVIADSLQSVAAVPFETERTALADINNALQSARAYGRAGVRRERGKVGLWGVYHGDWHDAVADRRYGSSGALGLDYQLSDDLIFGAGGRWGERDGDLSVFDGSFRSTAWGANAFATFEPEASGPRLYFGAAVDRFNNDITRGYLNGVTPDASEGEQEGVAYGAALTAGWRLGSGPVSVMPFADYQVTRISLDEFQETSGAFPARFDAVRDTTHLTRLGVEGNASATERLKLWATASWGHRFDDRAPGVSGVIIALSSPVGVAGVGVIEDWAEGRAGISWSPLARTFVELSGRVSNGGIAGNGDALEGGVSLRLSTAFN